MPIASTGRSPSRRSKRPSDHHLIVSMGSSRSRKLKRLSDRKFLKDQHFAFRIDVWDEAGGSIVEHVAGVDDFEMASVDDVTVDRTAQGLWEMFNSICTLTSNLMQHDVLIRGGLAAGRVHHSS